MTGFVDFIGFLMLIAVVLVLGMVVLFFTLILPMWFILATGSVTYILWKMA